VTEIVVEHGQATGVRVKIGNNATPTFIPARRVVSSAGYVNTFSHLVSEQTVQQFKIPKQLSVPQSAGFVMANIGKYFGVLVDFICFLRTFSPQSSRLYSFSWLYRTDLF